MRQIIALPVLALLLGGVASCAHGERYDPAAYRSALESELGHPVADWPAVEKTTRQMCDVDKDQFRLRVALESDAGTLSTYRIGVHYVCPNRQDEIDKALNEFAESGRACDIPADIRTQEQRDMAEALGC